MMKLLTPEEVIQALKDGKTVECKTYPNKDWRAISTSSAIYVLLYGNNTFRLAQQEMMTIGDVSFPKPESERPKLSTVYFFPNFSRKSLVDYHEWDDDDTDYKYLKSGLLHLSKENAIAHAKSLIKLSGGSYE